MAARDEYVETNAPAGPLWKNGIGVLDREADVGSCKCRPWQVLCGMTYCCGLPLWWADAIPDGDIGGVQPSTVRFGWCCGFEVPSADVQGTNMRFEGHVCSKCTFGSFICCCSFCCEPEIHAFATPPGQPERHIGRTKQNCHCWTCGREVVAETYDHNDVLRFQRIENTSCCKAVMRKKWCSCNIEHHYPIYDANKKEVAVVVEKESCCSSCYPSWTGIPNWPKGVSDEDKMLMLTIIMSKWFRSHMSADDDEEESS